MYGISKSSEILKAVIGKIRARSDIAITSQDIEEGFERPSFFVSLENIKQKNHMSNALERTGDIRISFFPSNKHKNQVEILDTQDLLTDIFQKERDIKLESGSVIQVDEADVDVVDKVLHFDFKIWLLELYDREITAENMEELIIEGV